MDGIFHASGRRLGTIKVHRYAHNSAEDLDRSLRSAPADAGKLVVTDGVFSMEGDIARLDEVAAVARRHGARIYLDEAHAIGVIGATGRGTEEHFGRPLSDLIMVHLFQVVRIPRRLRCRRSGGRQLHQA